MQSGLVSTIIPVFNRPAMLSEAVVSVLNQSYRPIEIIIVDDGSTDSTAEVIRQLEARSSREVRALHTPNSGPGLAREAGRQIARGEFIQYLDSDDLLLPGKFQVQVATLRANLDCGVAYGYSRLIDEDGEVLAAPYKWTGRTFRTLFPALLVDRWWNTPTPLFRRVVCDRVGPWSGMRMHEDWEYEARVAALGTRLVHCHEFLSEQRRHNSHSLTKDQPGHLFLEESGCLIESLHKSALRAGVARDCPEMKHFSRWAFSHARQAQAAGLSEQARRSLCIARSTAGPNLGFRLELKAFETMTAILGGTQTGKLLKWSENLVGRSAGSSTLPQSWMENCS